MPDVSVKVTIGAVTVEASGPQEYVDNKIEELIERFLKSAVLPSTSASTPKPFTPVLAEGGKKLSVREFIDSISHQNQIDRALAVGYYLEKYENLQNFTTKELLEFTKSAKYPVGNISEIVSRLVGRGLMMSAGEKDGARAYSLTASGESTIQSMAVAKE